MRLKGKEIVGGEMPSGYELYYPNYGKKLLDTLEEAKSVGKKMAERGLLVRYQYSHDQDKWGIFYKI